jgi:hypothetical protein
VREPTTKAGRAEWDADNRNAMSWAEYGDRIAAIEEDAREQERARHAALVAVLCQPHHLGFPVSGMTGNYDPDIVMVPRSWHDSLMDLLKEEG